MAAIVEFGQRQKQKKEKETAYVFESRIDDYLEEMEEKEELLSGIPSQRPFCQTAHVCSAGINEEGSGGGIPLL